MQAAPTYIPTRDNEDVQGQMETARAGDEDAGYATEPTVPHRQHEFSLAAGEFVLKLLEKYKNTQSSVDGIIKDLSSLWQTALEQIEDVLNANAGGVPTRLQSTMPTELLNPFDHLRTDYRRQSFFREAFDLLCPFF